MCIIVLSHFGINFYKKTQFSLYWEKANVLKPNSRRPASLPSLKILNHDIYRDFFNYEDYEMYLHYETELNVHSSKPNINKQEFKSIFFEILEKQVNEIKQSRIIPNDSILYQKFFSSLYKDLTTREINKGHFQFDLNFIPILSEGINYTNELNNKTTLDWTTVGSFTTTLENTQKSFEEEVLATPLPKNSRTYQYKAGQITLWIKQGKESPEGFIRLRRYFRLNELSDTIHNIEDDHFSINYIRSKSLKKKNKNGEAENIVTVDVYLNLNESQETSPQERIEIHFGKLLKEKFHSKNVALKPDYYSKEVIKTGELLFYGKVKINNVDHDFSSLVEKLVFNLNTGNFSSQTKINTKILRPTLNNDFKGTADYKVFQNIINNYGIQIIKRLNLGEIHSSFRGIKRGRLQ